MSASTVVFDDRKFRMFFSQVKSKSPKLQSQAVNTTTAFSLRRLKETDLPKRTGNLRGSYQQKAIDPITREIFSKSKYAPVIEFGGRARTISAKPGKRLTIPIKKSVLTGTRSQIKKSSLDKLFRRLKNRRRGESSRDVQEDVGIILAKSAKLKARRGQFNIKRKTQPFAENLLKKEVVKAYSQLGFAG